MAQTIALDGDLEHLLAEFHAARARRTAAAARFDATGTEADRHAYDIAAGDEQRIAHSLAMCLDNRTGEAA